jgi:hypothetical protein
VQGEVHLEPLDDSRAFDLEAASFRRVAVPASTAVTLRAQFHGTPLCGSGPESLLLFVPIHARYGAPVDAPSDGFYAAHFATLPLALEVVQARVAPPPGVDAAAPPPLNPASVCAALAKPAAPEWLIPVGNLSYLSLVYRATMGLVITAAVGVMSIAFLS